MYHVITVYYINSITYHACDASIHILYIIYEWGCIYNFETNDSGRIYLHARSTSRLGSRYRFWRCFGWVVLLVLLWVVGAGGRRRGMQMILLGESFEQGTDDY